MNQYQAIQFSTQNKVANISLNIPESMNAVSQQMRREIIHALSICEVEPDIHVVLLSAQGRGFSAGGDLKEGLAGYSTVEDKILAEYIPLISAIQSSSKIVVSAIHGVCAGIASGVALSSDLVAMSQSAYLYFPFSDLNLVPDGGVTYQLVNQLGYKKAFEIYLNAEKIPAQKCLDYGLVNHVYCDDSFIQDVQEWAEKIASKQPLSRSLGKQVFQHAIHHDLKSVIQFEAKQQVVCSQSPDTHKAIKAIFERSKSKEMT